MSSTEQNDKNIALQNIKGTFVNIHNKFSIRRLSQKKGGKYSTPHERGDAGALIPTYHTKTGL